MGMVGRAAVAAAVALAAFAAPMAIGSPEPLIVGGEPKGIAEFPWMVALTTTGSDAAYCGGALISPDRVLTAAHCVSGYSLSQVRVIAGRTDLSSDDGEERAILNAWVHPGYRSPVEGHDIAIVLLNQAVPYRVLPMETDPGAYRPGTPATVLGWGYTSERGPSSPVLRSAELALVEDSDCAATFSEFNPQTMVCAGAPYGGVDACYGDSGGPLVADGRLIGITSWGSGCAREDTPGVFVRIASYTAQVQQQQPQRSGLLGQ